MLHLHVLVMRLKVLRLEGALRAVKGMVHLHNLLLLHQVNLLVVLFGIVGPHFIDVAQLRFTVLTGRIENQRT